MRRALAALAGLAVHGLGVSAQTWYALFYEIKVFKGKSNRSY